MSLIRPRMLLTYRLDMATDELRKDLRAAVAARQELGEDYEPEIIDAFLERLDARIAARDVAPGGQPGPPQAQYPTSQQAGSQQQGNPQGAGNQDPGGLALAIVSVAAGIPVTAIAATQEGLFAIVVCWGGLVGINLARTVSRVAGR